MAPINGNLGKIIIGSLISIPVAVMGFMGKGIVDNDVRNTAQHVEIRKEQTSNYKELRNRMEDVKDIVIESKMEQRELSHFLKSKL